MMAAYCFIGGPSFDGARALSQLTLTLNGTEPSLIASVTNKMSRKKFRSPQLFLQKQKVVFNISAQLLR